ncbi:hypothetical protein [Mesorhizobium amorphae]|uniref:hypothetical protein n=1 Tax=Mesorhizobium amorphae TaxID=71433 RepID=UPI00118339A2|nr:hypothetical protein [Mesorhizobium amorphae]
MSCWTILTFDRIERQGKRFLKRVATIPHFPWSNKVAAADTKGKSMRISRANFERFKEERIIVRTGSGLTSNSYSLNPFPIASEVEEINLSS